MTLSSFVSLSRQTGWRFRIPFWSIYTPFKVHQQGRPGMGHSLRKPGHNSIRMGKSCPTPEARGSFGWEHSYRRWTAATLCCCRMRVTKTSVSSMLLKEPMVFRSQISRGSQSPLNQAQTGNSQHTPGFRTPNFRTDTRKDWGPS